MYADTVAIGPRWRELFRDKLSVGLRSNSIMNPALADIRYTVVALKKSGRTLDETVAAKSTAAHDGTWFSSVRLTKLVSVGV
jgi:hypothetical protein